MLSRRGKVKFSNETSTGKAWSCLERGQSSSCAVGERGDGGADIKGVTLLRLARSSDVAAGVCIDTCNAASAWLVMWSSEASGVTFSESSDPSKLLRLIAAASELS